jgi:hypothetical protein
LTANLQLDFNIFDLLIKNYDVTLDISM